MADWLLYEHDDGRHAVAPSADAATFANADPAWHRVGPVEVLAVDCCRGARTCSHSCEWGQGWNAAMEQVRASGVGGTDHQTFCKDTPP